MEKNKFFEILIFRETSERKLQSCQEWDFFHRSLFLENSFLWWRGTVVSTNCQLCLHIEKLNNTKIREIKINEAKAMKSVSGMVGELKWIMKRKVCGEILTNPSKLNHLEVVEKCELTIAFLTQFQICIKRRKMERNVVWVPK